MPDEAPVIQTRHPAKYDLFISKFDFHMSAPLTQFSLAFEFIRISYLFFPLLGGALLQGLCIRYGWLQMLNHPIDFDLRFRDQRVFGEHKTFRGLIGGATGSSLFAVFQSEVLHHHSPFASLEYFDYDTIYSLLFGFCLGLAASLSELPNSFAKRQLGIAPGKSAKGFWLAVFYFLDQVDVILGVWLYLSIFMELTVMRVTVSIAFVFVIHQLTTVAGHMLGLRKVLR